MLNTALLSQMSQKTYHTRYEKIILDRIRCEKALQVLRACLGTQKMCHIKGNVCVHVTSDVTTVSRSRLSGGQRQFQKAQLLIKFFAFQVIYKKIYAELKHQLHQFLIGMMVAECDRLIATRSP